MKVRFTRRAVGHLHAIAEYLAERSPVAGRQVGTRIHETIELLAKFPELGHDGALPGTREMVVPSLPYIIVHRVEPNDRDTLTVLGIYHGARLRPGQEPSATS